MSACGPADRSHFGLACGYTASRRESVVHSPRGNYEAGDKSDSAAEVPVLAADAVWQSCEVNAARVAKNLVASAVVLHEDGVVVQMAEPPGAQQVGQPVGPGLVLGVRNAFAGRGHDERGLIGALTSVPAWVHPIPFVEGVRHLP